MAFAMLTIGVFVGVVLGVGVMCLLAINSVERDFGIDDE